MCFTQRLQSRKKIPKSISLRTLRLGVAQKAFHAKAAKTQIIPKSTTLRTLRLGVPQKRITRKGRKAAKKYQKALLRVLCVLACK
jgi:hypothetical protein